MRPEDLELAAEFCKMVGVPDLLTYLGLDEQTDPTEIRVQLKARRKFMQGMQSNPKYKREALFLIKNFSSLNEVLADLPAYLGDAHRRAESEHLPVIEMTVRGVLAGGSVSEDQLDYLRRNATELGVSEATFTELLDRVGGEFGIKFNEGQADSSSPISAGSASGSPPLDLYQLLGVSNTANEDDVRIAYHRRLDELDALRNKSEQESMRRRIEIARKVLENEAARRHYDLTAARTGPPARAREFRPDQAATTPPVRDRAFNSGAGVVRTGPARLEILGDPVRTIRPGQTASIVIRNGGEGPMNGTITSDVRWLKVHPTQLNPSAHEQTISVQLLRGTSGVGTELPSASTTASVTIETERGERARINFEIRKGLSSTTIAAAGLASVGLILLLILLYLML